MGSQTGSYYSEHGRAVYMGKGPAKLRSLQRKLHPDTKGWSMKPTSLRGIAKVTAHYGVVSAEASTTEEPREGKLHAGIYAGDVE